jgi:hypothetical protein
MGNLYVDEEGRPNRRGLQQHHPLAIKAHIEPSRKSSKSFSEEIHREAMKLPLYRLAFERLGLKGPALAHLISHDEFALKTFPRDKLLRRYHLLPPFHRWKRKSRVLLMLASSTILNKHHRYYGVYLRYIEKFKDRPRKHWKATLRVARRIIIDLKRLVRENERQTPRHIGWARAAEKPRARFFRGPPPR